MSTHTHFAAPPPGAENVTEQPSSEADTLTPDERRSVEEFRQAFARLEGTTVLYGVGLKSRLIAKHLPRLAVVALIDPNCEGTQVYGLPVVSAKEAMALAPRQLIIAAGLAVNPTIYRRIEAIASEAGVRVLFINGDDATLPGDGDGQPDEPGFGEVASMAPRFGLISFDLFDTLVERKRPPETLVEEIAERVSNAGGPAHQIGSTVAETRFAGGESLCRTLDLPNPDLTVIYRATLEAMGLDPQAASLFARAEGDAEVDNVVPRREVTDLCASLHEAGHRVCVTTDTYHDDATLRAILTASSIPPEVPIFASCEYRRSKYDGTIWEILRSAAGGAPILHVGDCARSDGESARLAGVAPVLLPTRRDLAQALGLPSHEPDGFSVTTWDETVARILLNRPLASCVRGNRILLRTGYEAGYTCLGPLVAGYLTWLSAQVRSRVARRILFLARDGFLLERLWNRFFLESTGVPAAMLLTSRRAASVAAIRKTEDIHFVLERVTVDSSLTIGDLLARAFGLPSSLAGEDAGRRRLDWSGEDSFRRWFTSRFRDEVLQRATIERRGFEAHLRSTGMDAEDALLGVDLIARGTTQLALERLLPGLHHFCYLHTPRRWPDLGDRASAWSDGEGDGHAIEKRQLVVEAAVSAPFGQVVCYSADGVPLFEPEARRFAPAELHEGIAAFCGEVSRHPAIVPMSFTDADRSFARLFSPRIYLTEEVRTAFSFTDYYSPLRGEWEMDFSPLPRSDGRTGAARKCPER